MNTRQNHVVPDSSAARSGSRAWRAILAGGLTAGALDITYACVAWGLRGVSPIRVGQSVAAGLLGTPAARAGGLSTATLGFVLHFAMAIVMAAVYFAAATRMPPLVRRAVLFGSLYGLALYGVMNYVVIPLSAIQTSGASPPLVILVSGILVHMFLVGVPIALFTRRALSDPAPPHNRHA